MLFYTSILQWNGWEAYSKTNYLTQLSEKKSLALLRKHLAIARKKALQHAPNLKDFRLPG
jgi:hypothetical protein